MAVTEFDRGVMAAIAAGQRATVGVSVKTTNEGELQLRALTAAFDAMHKLIKK